MLPARSTDPTINEAKGLPMKLPSMRALLSDASAAFARFPAAILSAVVATASAITLVDTCQGGDCEYKVLFRAAVAGFLGISFLIAIVIVGERRSWSRGKNIAMQAVGMLLLIVYALFLPSDLFKPPMVHLIRFWLLMLASHLCVALAVLPTGETLGRFWHYNKTLFLRFLTAALFSAVLYAGLAVALAAIDHLFDMHVKPERYFELWWLIAGVVNTWLFVSGIPGERELLVDDAPYPKGLKVLAQYILIPIVLVYLVILYAYTGKILVDWQWPKGWVANLVLGFSVTGIFSLLLVYPIRNVAEHRWIKTFSRWYYIALVPLTILLLLSIWRRIAEYGITENRYFVIGLGFWLAAVVAYFILSKRGNIALIPLSLALLTMFSAFGPWGAFQVSERNQARRLEGVLVRNGMLQGGRVTRTTAVVSWEDQKDVSSIVEYLYTTHGLQSIRPWFPDSLGGLLAGEGTPSSYRSEVPKKVVESLGLPFVPAWQRQQEEGTRQFSASRRGVVDIRGYDLLVPSRTVNRTKLLDSLETIRGWVRLDTSRNGISVRIDAAGVPADSIFIDLSPMAERLLGDHSTAPYGIPPDAMTLFGTSEGWTAKVRLNVLGLIKQGESWRINTLDADIMLRGLSAQRQ
jgi:hypothetical protein